MIQLARHFADDRRRGLLEAAQRQRWFIKAREEQKRRDNMAEEAADDAMVSGFGAIMATETELATFQSKLDVRDAATIEALDENRIRLEEVQQLLLESEARIQDMLDRAYIMENGRRVFLTEDRLRAFDEFGDEVSQDDLDFTAVPENGPTYESFAKEIDLRNDHRETEQVLTEERQRILDYQEKLDEARERTADGNMTKDELEELDAELSDAMPLSVGRHMPDFEKEATSDPNAQLANTDTSSIAKIQPLGIQQGASFQPQ